ncbi:MAG: phosphoribosylglycinamide formyltransferase 1 [Microbacteriaceae bacterium]|nr:phosphoribosylglycinamide formyltransferase 1 [Microbacteriaceae bacterium]
MLAVAVLISGGGSNLRALLERCDDPAFPAHVVAVGADREASGLVHADEYGVPSFLVPYPRYSSREEWGDALLAQVQKWRPDVVVLSGFMRLLPPRVVDALAPKLLNTHPAFLPEFPGAHAVRDALEAGVAETGASVIVVDHGCDTGPVLARERVPVLPGDTEAVLHDRIKPVERRLLAEVLRDLAEGRIHLPEAA